MLLLILITLFAVSKQSSANSNSQSAREEFQFDKIVFDNNELAKSRSKEEFGLDNNGEFILQNNSSLLNTTIAPSTISSASSCCSFVAYYSPRRIIHALRLVISSVQANHILLSSSSSDSSSACLLSSYWEILVEAEVLPPLQNELQNELQNSGGSLFERIPGLLICYQVLTLSPLSPKCLPFAADFFPHVTTVVKIALPSPNSTVVHFWLRVGNLIQQDNSAGKLHDTDIYLPVFNLQNSNKLILSSKVEEEKADGGFDLHTWLLGKTISMQIDLTIPDEQQQQQHTQRRRNTQHIVQVIFHQTTWYSIQLYIPILCKQREEAAEGKEEGEDPIVQCAHLAQLLYQQLYFERILSQFSLFSSIQTLPSPYNPFIFLHLEKTGGTTLRSVLPISAKQNNISYYIPCDDGLSCFLFTFPLFVPQTLYDTQVFTSIQQMKETSSFYHQHLLYLQSTEPMSYDISILAGHFYWNIWNELPQCHHASSCKPSIFLLSRHPSERILSYYHERLYSQSSSQYYHRLMNSLSKEELIKIMVQFRFGMIPDYPIHPIGTNGEDEDENDEMMMIDEGMSNAMCRMIFNNKLTSGILLSSASSFPPSPSSDDEFPTEVLVQHLQQSVVGILERWEDTLMVLNHWFPWIQLPSINVQLNKHEDREEHWHDIREELQQVILQYNTCDLMLHTTMNALLDKQLQAMKMMKQATM